MGFLVTKYYPRRVIKAACTLKEKNKISKKSYKRYFHRKCGSYTGQYLMFLDIETDGILGELPTSNAVCEYVPNMKQFACVLYKTKDFFENPTLTFPTFYEYKNLNTHSGYIINFLKLYTYYDNPCLIAHNGCAFDFKIIIAHIKRYVMCSKEICKSFRFFDTYIAIQVLLHRQSAKKWPKQSLKNTSLFMRHSSNYANHSYLVHFAHQALPDCTMTLLWVHALRHNLNWKQYNGYMDI